MKNFFFVLLVTGLLLSAGPVWAKDGLYLGMDLGVAMAPDMDVQTGGFDDWTTDEAPTGFQGVLCDTHIFPEPSGFKLLWRRGSAVVGAREGVV